MNNLEYFNVFEENIGNLFPKTNQKFYDNLDSYDKELYLGLNYAYRVLFTLYINKHFNLKKYEEQIEKSKFKFPILKKEKMDIYQYLSSQNFKYFYVRNNFYVERLSIEDKTFLFDCLENLDIISFDDIDKFIEKTYERVIFENVLNSGQICDTNYGPINPKYYFPNNSLIIGFRYEEFSDDSETISEEKEKMIFLNELFENMHTDLNYKVKAPLQIVQYDDFSIKPLKKNSNLTK